MYVHNGKVYIVGGFRFKDNIAKKLFSLTQVVELDINTSGSLLPTLVRIIELVESPQMTIENVYGFGSVGTGSHIYLFGGCKVPSYDDTKENLHEFLPPVQTRGEFPLLSSVLYHIDLKEEKIEELHAPKELATAGPTIHITDIDSEGKAERIFIMGGTLKQNILYTKSEFEL